METKIWYEVSYGEKVKMYTIWRCVSHPKGYNRQYLQNLSTDFDKAMDKAKVIANGHPIYDDTVELNPITRRAKIDQSRNDVMRFGKHRGVALKDLPEGYLLWVASGAQIKSENNQSAGFELEYICLVSFEFQQKAKLVALDRGLYDILDGQLMPKRLVEYITRLRNMSGHHFKNNEMVNLQGQIIQVRQRTDYSGNPIWIYYLVSSYPVNNKLFICTSKESLVDGNRAVEKGHQVEVEGKIFHTKFKEENQTKINNLKSIRITSV
jgi:hypothetical protein